MKQKNILRRLQVSTLMLSAFLSFIACSKDSESKDDPIINPEVPVVPETPEVGHLTAAEQKAKIDAAGHALLDQIDASDFKYYSKLGDYVDTEFDDYDDKAITEWAEDLLDQMSVKTGDEQTSYEGYSYVDIYKYTNYERLIILSNFTGHFKAENKRWTYTKANDLKFTFKDHESKECTLTLEVSGKTTDVYFGTDEDWYDYYYYEHNGLYYYESYINRYEQTVRVPSSIEVTLKQGGTTKAALSVEVDLSGMSSTEFNLERDAYSASGTLSIGDYSIQNAKVAYNSTSNAGISASVKKGSKTLISEAWTAQGNYQQETVKTVNLVIDVMGLIQIKGTISDGRSFYDYLENANKNDQSESRFKSNVSLANDLLNLGVYYDGKDTREAKVQLEAFHNNDKWRDYWYCEPVFYFGDESSYTTFDVYFETGFDKLISKYEKIVNDFERLF